MRMSKSKKQNLIYLTGFSTAGKTTLGPILANTLGYTFVDIDREIMRAENKSVNEIFSEKGESYFRDMELLMLRKFASLENTVVALGGGTLEKDECFRIVSETGLVVYLRTDVETLKKRLANKSDRPMLKDKLGRRLTTSEIESQIEKLFTTRKSKYMAADIAEDTDKTDIGRTVDRLAKEISRFWKNDTSALPTAASGKMASKHLHPKTFNAAHTNPKQTKH
jgi:shikimate kinase